MLRESHFTINSTVEQQIFNEESLHTLYIDYILCIFHNHCH